MYSVGITHGGNYVYVKKSRVQAWLYKLIWNLDLEEMNNTNKKTQKKDRKKKTMASK